MDTTTCQALAVAACNAAGLAGVLGVAAFFALIAGVQTWRARYWKRVSMRPPARKKRAGPTSLEPGPHVPSQRETPHERPRDNGFDDPGNE